MSRPVGGNAKTNHAFWRIAIAAVFSVACSAADRQAQAQGLEASRAMAPIQSAQPTQPTLTFASAARPVSETPKAAPDATKPLDVSERRQQIAQQRQVQMQRFDALQAQCQQRFAISACVQQVERERRAALAPLRAEELALAGQDRSARADAQRVQQIEKQRAHDERARAAGEDGAAAHSARAQQQAEKQSAHQQRLDAARGRGTPMANGDADIAESVKKIQTVQTEELARPTQLANPAAPAAPVRNQEQSQSQSQNQNQSQGQEKRALQSVNAISAREKEAQDRLRAREQRLQQRPSKARALPTLPEPSRPH